MQGTDTIDVSPSANTEDATPRTREARIAQERKAVGEPLLIKQSNTYPPTTNKVPAFERFLNPGEKGENMMAKRRKNGGTNRI